MVSFYPVYRDSQQRRTWFRLVFLSLLIVAEAIGSAAMTLLFIALAASRSIVTVVVLITAPVTVALLHHWAARNDWARGVEPFCADVQGRRLQPRHRVLDSLHSLTLAAVWFLYVVASYASSVFPLVRLELAGGTDACAIVWSHSQVIPATMSSRVAFQSRSVDSPSDGHIEVHVLTAEANSDSRGPI